MFPPFYGRSIKAAAVRDCSDGIKRHILMAAAFMANPYGKGWEKVQV
jgi:hypothetical protein